MGCPGVIGPCCLISEEKAAAAINGIQSGKAVGPTGVVSETMKRGSNIKCQLMT